MTDYNIAVAYNVQDGTCKLFCWRKGTFSKRELRRMVKQQALSVSEWKPEQLSWCRFYYNVAEMKKHLPEG